MTLKKRIIILSTISVLISSSHAIGNAYVFRYPSNGVNLDPSSFTGERQENLKNTEMCQEQTQSTEYQFSEIVRYNLNTPTLIDLNHIKL